MKLIAGIMAFMVLALSIQPVFAHQEKNVQSECASHCCGEDEAEAEVPADTEEPVDPCSDFCNPILKCGACASSTIEFLNFTIQKPAQELTRHLVSTQKVYSQFDPDFWQPPKIA